MVVSIYPSRRPCGSHPVRRSRRVRSGRRAVCAALHRLLHPSPLRSVNGSSSVELVVTDIRTSIGKLSGKRPSARVETVVKSYLLPGEPIIGALVGTVRLQATWFVATESVVLQVRDGMATTLEHVVLLLNITGWQEVPSWGSTKFLLETNGGSIFLDQVKSNQAAWFVHAIEQALAAAGDSGFPTVIDRAFLRLDDFEAAVGVLLRDRPLAKRAGDPVPADLVRAEFTRPIASAISDWESEGYGSALLFWCLPPGGCRRP